MTFSLPEPCNFFHSGSKSKENEGFEIVSKEKTKKRSIVLNPEELALGQALVTSKKARRDIEDAAWNRYMFDDRDQV